MKIQSLIILILLQFTHLAADYTHLSTKWMLNAKRLGRPLFPIYCHALIHAVLVEIILFIFISDKYLVFELSLLQLFSHFLIDVWKGKMNIWFPSLQNTANKYHWYIFGFDQLLHQIVLIVITYLAVNP